MFNIVKKSFAYGAHQVTLETGEIARQASGAVLVSMEDTVVLVTVVGAKSAKSGQDFFPLTVDYQEKVYAAGRIPGGFFKREGRPTEKETLTCRLIDRPIRPLFPDGFYNEVQIVATVMSLNPEIDPDIPALIGASAALAISGLPFNGPIGAARVGYIDGQYVLCPTLSQLKESQLDLVVAGTESAVLMVESEASIEAVLAGVDVLIADCSYTAAEYPHKRDWGHGTFTSSLQIAQRIGAKNLFCTHHEPTRDDIDLEAVFAEALSTFSPGNCAIALAREGLEYTW